LRFHESGNYEIDHIPEYPIFQKALNDKYTQYRKSTKSGSPQGRTKTPPKTYNFETNEETILGVIKSLIQGKKDLEEKLQRLIKYIKKLKAEKKELLLALKEID